MRCIKVPFPLVGVTLPLLRPFTAKPDVRSCRTGREGTPTDVRCAMSLGDPTLVHQCVVWEGLTQCEMGPPTSLVLCVAPWPRLLTPKGHEAPPMSAWNQPGAGHHCLMGAPSRTRWPVGRGRTSFHSNAKVQGLAFDSRAGTSDSFRVQHYRTTTEREPTEQGTDRFPNAALTHC